MTDVSGVIFWGANARGWGAKLADNPYAAAPGTYVLHRAWAYGFQNAASVLAEHFGDDPNDPAYDDVRGPLTAQQRSPRLILNH